MKRLLIKLCKVLLLVAAAALVMLLVFGLVLSLDWPWWVGGCLLLALAGLILAVVLVKRLLKRRREQQFVSEMIEQDEQALQGVEAKERERLQELQDRWKEAVQALRQSQLKRRGNPLYVLPWYLVVGESGSGKTTAIQSARLSSPFAEIPRTSGISGTRNCDWWFFEQAILIDTAGRYAIPVDEGRDKEEWQRFLSLLVKYRKKEPLNGLVVAVAADKLLQAAPEALEEDGKNIRRRIDELMRVLGSRFPVYLLVTKCDLVQGMTRFCDLLTEAKLEEAMGVVNEDFKRDALDFEHRTMETLADHLRDHRLILLHHPDRKGIDPALLVFPEEFEKLKGGLDAFIKGAFKENPYQETPFLRGLYFTSGRQEGTPYSHFLRALGLIEEREVLKGTSRGLFLHDFFAKILPGDRHLLAPTQRAVHWKRLTRSLGLASWAAVVIALCGLLSFSFVKNLRTLRAVSHEFVAPPTLTGDLVADLRTMERFKNTLLKVEAENRNWWIPRFGLKHSIEVERALKRRYCDEFRQGFLASFDRDMGSRIGGFSALTADLTVAAHVEHLVRRIHLLKGRMEGKGLEALQSLPQPSYGLILSTAGTAVPQDLAETFGGLYLYSLVWRPSSEDLRDEWSTLERWLSRILELPDKDWRWLIAWANVQPALEDVTLESFWGGSGVLSPPVKVDRAFRRDGSRAIEAFVAEMETALEEPLRVSERKAGFFEWYRSAYLEAWHRFAADFPQGVGLLADREEWRQAARRMGTADGPYFAVLDMLALELEPVAGLQENPVWVNQVLRYQLLKARASGAAVPEASGVLSRAAEKGKQILSGLESRVSKVGAGLPDFDDASVAAFADYRKALGQLAPAADSRKAAFEFTAQAFGEDTATHETPFRAAHKALMAWKGAAGLSDGGDAAVWHLARGPWDFLWRYCLEEAACAVQRDWDENVLAEIQGLPNSRAVEKLLAEEEGLAWAFVKGPVAPFIDFKLKRSYYAKEVLGAELPFEAGFFAFINQGTVAKNVMSEAKSQYTVTVKALPTDCNRDARLKPHATRLIVQCDDGPQQMLNLNYPVQETFIWSPESCGDVIIEIEVAQLKLTRKYSGGDAFPRFLRDFSRGERTFRSGEFGSGAAGLKQLGIREIIVRYEFRGHGPILKLREQAPRTIPRTIVTCWDGS